MNNYYNVGTKEDIVISNSSLSRLNPDEGGSIKKFMNFFSDKEEEKNSLSLERGKLIHKYIENKDAFIVAEIEKPTDMMAGLIEKIVVIIDDIKKGLAYNDVNITLESNLKSEKAQTADIIQRRVDFEKLSIALNSNVDNTIRAFILARHATNAYISKGDSVVISDIVNKDKERDYIRFLLKARDKIALTTIEKEKLTGCINSLQLHPKVSMLLGLENNDFDSVVGDVFKELPIYWQETVVERYSNKKITINCKGLLDRVVVNHQAKTISLPDLKSTRRSIYQYQVSFEYYHTYRQMAIYLRALKFWFTSIYPDLDFNAYTVNVYIIPVETEGFYQTGVYAVNSLWLFKGRDEAKELMTRFAWHKETGEYNYSPEEILSSHILSFKNPQ